MNPWVDAAAILGFGALAVAVVWAWVDEALKNEPLRAENAILRQRLAYSEINEDRLVTRLNQLEAALAGRQMLEHAAPAESIVPGGANLVRRMHMCGGYARENPVPGDAVEIRW